MKIFTIGENGGGIMRVTEKMKAAKSGAFLQKDTISRRVIPEPACVRWA
jgi:hypothetical protein